MSAAYRHSHAAGSRRILRSFRLPVVLLIILCGLTLAWIGRRPFTEAAVGRWFAIQGVEARYRITALSPTTVSLQEVSLGPAAYPDFTAARIDVTVGWSPLRPSIAAVRLVRPVLHATLARNGISFGSLDQLLPAPGHPARALPNIDLTITGGNLRVATAAGSLSGTFNGAGVLGGGFRGHWAIDRTVLAAGGCTTALTNASIALVSARDAAHIAATGMLDGAACAEGSSKSASWRLSAVLPPTLDRYSAQFDIQAARLVSANVRAETLVLRGDAAASTLDGPLTGHVSANAEAVAGASFSAAHAAAAGPYRFDPRTGVSALTAAVEVTRASALPVTAQMHRTSRQLAGTLAQPLYSALLTRGSAAARSFDASAQIAIRNVVGGFNVEVSALTASAANGARLRQNGRVMVSPGGVALAGGATLSGGGLPSLTIAGAGRTRGDTLEGTATLAVAPWSVPGGSIGDFHIEARGESGSTTLTGFARLSGALGGGVAAQRIGIPIRLAIDQRGSVAFGRQCLSIDWAGLRRDTVAFGPGTARLCPAGNSIAEFAGGRASGHSVLAPLVLRGRSGDTALSVETAALRLTLSGTTVRPRMILAPALLSLKYGAMRAAATLDGAIDLADARAAGRLAAARFDSADLPVAITAGGGLWQFAGGRLDLADGLARVTDRIAPARFQPLRIDGASVVVANGRIDADGTGRLAAGGARLFGFTAMHTLASGRGAATVDTGILRFGSELQPYQITEAMRGVVDNVAGPVSGHGQLAWTETTLTSHGTLAIDHLALATQSLGPVDDVAGTLEFDNLLTLTTPPGQLLTIKRINPGVAVDDGIMRFQLLGSDAAMIESIVWPYAGGTLTLAPVTVRAGDTMRSFTLTVDGLDAAQFLQKFDIKDLNVTGSFDGKLPLIFTDGTGRIAEGTLVALAGGGLVQYVGAVGGEDLGAGARLAFDALRRLRYHSLAIGLDGDLDGELVTELRFAGTNEAATTLGGGRLPIRATGLPFRFNVTVRAPFRALLGTASSFSDVRPLMRPATAGVQPQ